jgi:hypothetical protein
MEVQISYNIFVVSDNQFNKRGLKMSTLRKIIFPTGQYTVVHAAIDGVITAVVIVIIGLLF